MICSKYNYILEHQLFNEVEEWPEFLIRTECVKKKNSGLKMIMMIIDNST